MYNSSREAATNELMAVVSAQITVDREVNLVFGSYCEMKRGHKRVTASDFGVLWTAERY